MSDAADLDASSDTTTVPLKPLTENESSRVAEAPTDTSEPKTPPTFDDPTVRRAFVRKVLGIQILTLLFPVGVVCLFTFSDVIREGVSGNVWVFISSFIIFIAVFIIFRIIDLLNRWHHWWNLAGLALVTLSLSFMLGTMSYFSTTSLTALGDTILICLAIIAFNAQGRVDYNMWFGFILSVAVPLITLGIMYGIFPDLFFMRYVALGGVEAFMLSMVFVVNIQGITVWDKASWSPEEYVEAVLWMYDDIMVVLMLLLALPCYIL